ncbi:hypothetical protein PG994_005104 [Apiospora phragmitis]|uniref:Uncharacterized protein n=1 Tax=Apiospora phragmitis TaxID=2905665 RepID=A0ABR1VSH3_9PEZI
MQRQTPNRESLLTRYVRYLVNENAFGHPTVAIDATSGASSSSEDSVAVVKRDKKESGDKTKSEKIAIESEESPHECCSRPAHGPQFEESILSAVGDLIDSQLRAEVPKLVEKAVHEALQDAAKEEINNPPDPEEGDMVKVITSRLKELDEDTLESVFMQRSMVEILKRLVKRAESDMELMEWEKI